MTNEQLKNYINQRLTDLQKGKDINDVLYKGRLSFGVDPKLYSHLPAWTELLNQKRTFKRSFWAGSFGLALVISSVTMDLWEKLQQNWWKALIMLVLTSMVIALFNIALAYFSLFVTVRKTEREVRKLIYQDILSKLDEAPVVKEKAVLT